MSHGSSQDITDTSSKTNRGPVDSVEQVVRLKASLSDLASMHQTLREATATCVRHGNMNTAADLVKVIELIECLLSIRCEPNAESEG